MPPGESLPSRRLSMSGGGSLATSTTSSAMDIATLVDDARAGGLEVELRKRGDLSRIPPTVGVTLYRIGQEALANAVRHAPHARTALEVEVAARRGAVVGEKKGATLPGGAF